MYSESESKIWNLQRSGTETDQWNLRNIQRYIEGEHHYPHRNDDVIYIAQAKHARTHTLNDFMVQSRPEIHLQYYSDISFEMQFKNFDVSCKCGKRIIWYHIFKFLYLDSFLSSKLGPKSSSSLSKSSLNSLPLSSHSIQPNLHWLFFSFLFFFFCLLYKYVHFSPATNPLLFPVSTTEAIISDSFSPSIVFPILYKKNSGSKLADIDFSLIVWEEVMNAHALIFCFLFTRGKKNVVNVEILLEW